MGGDRILFEGEMNVSGKDRNNKDVKAWAAQEQAHAAELKADRERAAHLLIERQKQAENAFSEADTDHSGSISQSELLELLMHIQQREIEKDGVTAFKHGKLPDREAVSEWLKSEYDKADIDHNGEIDFDEFVEYYNNLITHMHWKFGDHDEEPAIMGYTVDEMKEQMHQDEADEMAALAKGEAQAIKLHEEESHLVLAVEEADTAMEGMDKYLKQMAGDWELMKHEEKWLNAAYAFARDAFGLDDHGKRKKELTRPPTMLELASCLPMRLWQAEPGYPAAIAVVLWHPTAKGLLKVYESDEADTHLKAGSNIRPKDPQHPDRKMEPVHEDIWQVMESKEALLRNPHGLVKAGEEGEHSRSVIPLLDRDKRVFGAIVSGPPALPDGLLQRFQPTAGGLFEGLWRLEQVATVTAMAGKFLLNKTRKEGKLVYVTWKPGARLHWKQADWEWQPLMHSPPGEEKKFELELRWSDPFKDPIGVWSIDLGSHDEMDEALVAELHTLAPIVQTCVEDIEKAHVGDANPLASQQSLEANFDAMRLMLPMKLQAEVRAQIENMGAVGIFHEIQGYTSPTPNTIAVLRGVLALLGHKRDDTKDWKHVKPLMTPKIAEEMLALEMSADTKKMEKLFTESLHCTQKLDLHAVAKEVPAGVRMLLRWLETTRMVHHIAISDHASAMAEHDEQLAKLEGHGEGGHAKHGKGGHGKGKHGKGHGEHDEHGHKRH